MYDFLVIYDDIDYFGQVFNDKHNFPENEVKVVFYFDTPNEVIEEVSFDATDSYGVGGDRILVIAPRPNALPWDEDVVGIQVCLNDTQPARLSMFVNDNPEDPNPPLVRDDTNGGEPYPVPRTTWLRNGTRYYGTYFRLNVNEGQHYRGMPLMYQCQPNVNEYEPLDPPQTIPLNGAVALTIEGVPGVWTPKVT